MTDKNKVLLNKIITQKAKEFGFEVMKAESFENVISILREDWHLFVSIDNPNVEELSLQMSVYADGDDVRMLFFPSPIVINESNIDSFVKLCNEANRYLYRGKAMGRFWVDEENLDFAYEIIIKEEWLEHFEEEVGKQLFDIPYAHYEDLQVPLIMLAKEEWDADTAVKYLTELRDDV